MLIEHSEKLFSAGKKLLFYLYAVLNVVEHSKKLFSVGKKFKLLFV